MSHTNYLFLSCLVLVLYSLKVYALLAKRKDVQVVPMPYGELAPRVDQEAGLYPQETYGAPAHQVL